MESGCDRFLSVENPKLELWGSGGLLGGVSNMSSEEELCLSFAYTPAFRTHAAWVGTADEVLIASALTKSSAISSSG